MTGSRRRRKRIIGFTLISLACALSIAWQGGTLIPPERMRDNARIRHVTEAELLTFVTTTANSTRLKAGDIFRIDGEPHLFKLVDSPTPGDGGVTKPVHVDGVQTFNATRQFDGPVHLKWYGAVPDFDGTTGTDNAAAINAAIAYCNSNGRELFLDGDYFTTGTHDPSTLAGVVGPGSVNGNSVFRQLTKDGTKVISKVDPVSKLVRFPGGLSYGGDSASAVRSWILIDGNTERPNTATEATELRLDLPVFTSTITNYGTFVRFTATSTRGNASNSNDGLVLVDTLVSVSSRFSGSLLHSVDLETTYKNRTGNSDDLEDLDLSAFVDGNELVLRIQPLLSANVNTLIQARVEVFGQSTVTVDSLSNASWQLQTGQTALSESSNQYIRPHLESDVLYLRGEEVGNTSQSNFLGAPLGVFAVADSNWTVDENTAYLQRKVDAARTAGAKLFIIGDHKINDTISCGNWQGLIIEGLQLNDSPALLKHGITWLGGVQPTKPMLTLGNRFGVIRNLSLFGWDNGQNATVNNPQACIAWEETAGVGEGHMVFELCAFYGSDFGFYAGLDTANSNKADLRFEKCYFTANQVAGFTMRTAQNLNYQFDDTYFTNLFDAPLFLVNGGGGLEANLIHIVRCNEICRLDADGTEFGISNGRLKFENIKVDAQNDRVPTFLNMIAQAGTQHYGGTIVFDSAVVSSGVVPVPTSPLFILRGSIQVLANDVQINKTVAGYNFAEINFGGTNAHEANPKFRLTNSRLHSWDGSLNAGNLTFTVADDGGVASKPFYEVIGCFDQLGVTFADVGNTPGVVPTANSSLTVTANGANQSIDVTNVAYLDLAPTVASSFSTLTGGFPGQLLVVSANDLSTLNHGTAADAMELDLSQPLAVGTGGWDGIFRFNGVFWDQLGGSQK